MDDAHKQQLEALARSRIGGAVNIKGVTFQLLATLRELLRMCGSTAVERVRPEGLEDVDIHVGGGRRYVQVKTSSRPWNVSNLDDVIGSFLPVLDADLDCRLVLLLDREPGQDLRRLVDGDRAAAVAKLARRPPFAPKSGRTPEDAGRLLDRLTVEHVAEGELYHEVLALLHGQFELSGDHADEMVLALLGRTMDAARERRELAAGDVKRWHAEAVEAAAERSAMADVGVLVGMAHWDAEENAGDFLQGKAARPGHVAAGFDVPRPAWVDRVAAAVEGAGVCVIRSASGQGKTTLALRYALDRWPCGATYLLQSCGTAEEAEKVGRWLRFRARLGLATLLVCEGDTDCRRWPLVAQRCGELRVPMVVAVRREDWVRFAEASRFNYEVVDPELTLDEACGIFKRLRQAGRLHSDAPPAEQAFERAGRDGERPLLMEYAHLLTQGRTLAERLGEQVRQVTRLGEDPARLVVARLAVVAHGLGVAVDPARLGEVVTFRDDPQQVLDAIDGEFVAAGDRRLTGLHHVRSRELRRLLHGHAVVPTMTALGVLKLIGDGQLAAFASASLADAELDAGRLLDALAERSSAGGTAALLAVLDGCFEAGERRFLEANAATFDAAAADGGMALATLLAIEVLPMTPVDVSSQLAGVTPRLAELRQQVHADVPRGRDLCRQLLQQIDVPPMLAAGDAGTAGRLLDWLHACGIEPPDPQDRLPDLWGEDVLSTPLGDLCDLAQGVGRVAPAWFTAWFRDREPDIVGYLMLHLDCTRVRLLWDEQPPAVEVEFVPGEDGTPHEQTMKRVNALRRLLPQFGRFACRGDWSLVPAAELMPWLQEHDETVKNIPARNLPLPSDVAKNVVFSRLVEVRFTADTYHQFEQKWHDLRAAALDWCGRLDRILRDWLEGESKRIQKAASSFQTSSQRLMTTLTPFPIEPPRQFPAVLRKAFGASREHPSKPNRWHSHLRTLVLQCLGLIDPTKDRHAARLAAVNMAEAEAALPDVHAAFDTLAENGPIYFDFAQQAEREFACWTSLRESVLLAAARRRGAGGRSLADTRRRLRDRQRAQVERGSAALIDGCAARGVPLLSVPVDPLPGMNDGRYMALRDAPLTTLPVVFGVDDPLDWEAHELAAVLDELREHCGLAERFALVPTLAGRSLLGQHCLMISAHRLAGTDADRPANVLPVEVPEDIRRLIPGPDASDGSGLFKAVSLLQVLASLVRPPTQDAAHDDTQNVEGRFSTASHERRERAARERNEQVRQVAEQVRAAAARLDQVAAGQVNAAVDELIAGLPPDDATND